ncbi:32_t:CDS:2 [Paraglomus occultum]|uniref:32_t:CDS:1 n=1 Tax=Paraglomus occultum TaxID=144539 RepID=A0A9N8WRK9_9GLOM|nr:32_t:CDS:2 [Paraglomus occultum]
MQKSWTVGSYFYLVITLLFYTIQVSTNPLNSSTHLLKRYYETDLTQDVPAPVDIPTNMVQCGGSMKFSSFQLQLTPSTTPGISPVPSSSLTKNLPYLYNVPIITGAGAILIIAVLQASNIMQAKATTSHFQHTDSKELSHEQAAILITPPLAAQSPSIYDVFRAVQFLVTTALLSIPCLLNSLNLNFSYRGVASKLAWTCGIPPQSFHAGFISNAADNKIREGICHISESQYLSSVPPSSGFTDFGAAVGIPGNDLFFMVLIIFCFALLAALVVALLVGSLARLLKSLWEKWSILKTAAQNIHFLILVISIGTVSVCIRRIINDMRHNREAFESPVHKIVLGAFYTQYRDSSESQPTRIWFFVITIGYDFIRAIVIGAGRRNGLVQGLFLLITELFYFFSLVLYKPYITDLMNKLNISISFLKSTVVILLLPYSNVCTSTALQSVAFALQTIIMTLLLGVMFAKSAMMVKGYVDKKKNDNDNSTATTTAPPPLE